MISYQNGCFRGFTCIKYGLHLRDMSQCSYNNMVIEPTSVKLEPFLCLNSLVELIQEALYGLITGAKRASDSSILQLNHEVVQ